MTRRAVYFGSMRAIRGPLGVAALAVVLLVPGREAARPLVLHGPDRQTKELVGLVFADDGARLSQLDESTLEPFGPRSARIGFAGTWALERPDGHLAAIATTLFANDSKQVVRFVNLSSRRLVRRTIQLDGYAWALLWARPDRLVAVVASTCCDGRAAVETFDTGSRKLVSRRELDGDIGTLARSPDGLVVLETPRNAIGPARLDAIGADGSLRSVALDRVVAGATWPQDSSGDPLGTQREAALAVDPDGYRAYVVQPDGPAAEIALGTLAVSYHDLSAPRSLLRRFSAWFTPAAAAKGMNGPRRTAAWLGDGLLAVTGSDEHSVRKNDSSIEMGYDPAGLAILDTRDWSIQRLDPGADTVTVADGVLLATGRRLAPGQDTPTGMGLAAYGADRSLRFRLFQGASSWVVRTLGGRAYVENGIGQESIAVVDLGSGAVLQQRPGPLAAPLLDDAPVG
jgi:hypothetical protein